MELRDFFIKNIDKFKAAVVPADPNSAPSEDELMDKVVEGRDISVCVRSRPLLDFEMGQEYFNVTHAESNKFHFLEAKLNVRLMPTLEKHEFQVDHGFGPQDDNQTVYSKVAAPLVDLSLQGGVSSLFAYGQTGSGKTYTI